MIRIDDVVIDDINNIDDIIDDAGNDNIDNINKVNIVTTDEVIKLSCKLLREHNTIGMLKILSA